MQISPNNQIHSFLNIEFSGEKIVARYMTKRINDKIQRIQLFTL